MKSRRRVNSTVRWLRNGNLTCNDSPRWPVMMTLQSKFTYWLRWLVVLPGGMLASLVALFPLHLILYFTFKDNVESYPKWPERTLTPFVVAGVLVWAGSRIAPEFKMTTAIVLS